MNVIFQNSTRYTMITKDIVNIYTIEKRRALVYTIKTKTGWIDFLNSLF